MIYASNNKLYVLFVAGEKNPANVAFSAKTSVLLFKISKPHFCLKLESVIQDTDRLACIQHTVELRFRHVIF